MEDIKFDPDDPETKSADLFRENIERLGQQFPELITEDEKGVVVNLDVLKTLIGDRTVTDAEEKFGLNWYGKRQARKIALTPSTGTLRPCPEDSVDWETTKNLMIEGDNMEVLKLLQKSYAGKVKMIYIDPPYNTGNDFVYPDNYQDAIANYLELTGQVERGIKKSSNTESSGRFHTDWLNMMYPRLKLSRSLLREDGFICISISDEELASLKRILDELFGEENYRNTIVVRRFDKNLSRQFMDNGLFSLSVGYEYVVVYSKSQKASLNPIFREASQERQANGYWKGFWNDADRPTMRYELLGVRPERGQWKWQESVATEAMENYQEYLENYAEKETLEEYWARTGKCKKFIRRNNNGKGVNQGVEHWVAPSTGILRSSNWCDLLVSNPSDLMGVPFPNPKSVNFLQQLIQMTSEEGDLILDFFAGSGTTGHAVLVGNTSTEIDRNFILVQLPEVLNPENKEQIEAVSFCDTLGKPRNISELTKERIRRVSQKVKKETPLVKRDYGFKVFKLDSSNIIPWEARADNLPESLLGSIEHIRLDRQDSDILFELLLKLGLELNVPIEVRLLGDKKLYSIGEGVIFAYLVDKITTKDVEPITNSIIRWKSEYSAGIESLCVFIDSAFENDVVKSNMAAILSQNHIQNIKSL